MLGQIDSAIGISEGQLGCRQLCATGCMPLGCGFDFRKRRQNALREAGQRRALTSFGSSQHLPQGSTLKQRHLQRGAAHGLEGTAAQQSVEALTLQPGTAEHDEACIEIRGRDADLCDRSRNVCLSLTQIGPATQQFCRHAKTDLRRALLDASLSILEQDGPHALARREVARRAGVSHTAPYSQLADKDYLLHTEQRSTFAMTLRAKGTEEIEVGGTKVSSRIVEADLLGLEIKLRVDEQGRILRFEQPQGKVKIELQQL